MDADKLLYDVGIMLEKNRPRLPDEEAALAVAAKERFDNYVRALAAGRPGEELTSEEIRVFFYSDLTHAELPEDIAKVFGLPPGSDYSDAFAEAHEAWRDISPTAK